MITTLLQHRKDGNWGLPGGLMERGESLEETAIREVYEETGLTLKCLTLLELFSGPRSLSKTKKWR
jgi:8-oxo-dGTP pyrophosphatase MutT (NUDIX family)